MPSHNVWPFSNGSIDIRKPLRTRGKSAVITANVPPQIVNVMCTVRPAKTRNSLSKTVCPMTSA